MSLLPHSRPLRWVQHGLPLQKVQGLLDSSFAARFLRSEQQCDGLREELHQVFHQYTLRDGLRQRTHLDGLLHEEVDHRLSLRGVVTSTHDACSNRELVPRRPELLLKLAQKLIIIHPLTPVEPHPFGR
jgi:hypothetical protein